MTRGMTLKTAAKNIGFLVALGVAALLLWPRLALSQADGGTEIPINAILSGLTVYDEDSPIGTVQSGPLKGSKQATYLGASFSAGMPGVEPPSTYSHSGVQTFHTSTGDLEMTVLGVSDMGRQIFTELCRITGGTGRFQGAIGNLYISGVYEADGVTFHGKITGKVKLSH